MTATTARRPWALPPVSLEKATAKTLATGATAALVTIAMTLLWTVVAPHGPQTPLPLQPPTSAQVPPGGLAAAAANPYVYSDVAERAVHSVVSITTSKLIRSRSRNQGTPHQLFRRFGPQGRRPHGASGGQHHHRQGAGSGVIVRKDGMVLTNSHVIDGADKIRVQLADNRSFDAEVVGSDPRTDLAVLKLKGDVGKLQVLTFTDSDKVRLGEVVLAIGNSFGRLHHTVTMGIVSAKGRGNVGIVDYEDFIQTDAAINPGNSGGALVNMRGELVGINTAIASRSGGSQGVGFTIPANMARTIMASILDNGRVDRGWLGVAIQNMNDEMMKASGTGVRGVLIGDVAKRSPAARAGLRRGDVVLRFSGKRVQRTARLRNMVALSGVGAKVQVEISRRSKKQIINVELGGVPHEK